MRGVRLCRVFLAVACTAPAVTACGSTDTLPTGTALYAPSGAFGYAVPHVALGQIFSFGLYIFQTPVNGAAKGRIQVRDLTLLDVPKGLAIDGVWGERFSRGAPRTGVLPIPNTAGDVRYGYPPSAIVLDPACSASAHCAPTAQGEAWRLQDWILVVDAHITQTGSFKTTGFRVVYEVDGQRYQQTIPGVVGMGSGEMSV